MNIVTHDKNPYQWLNARFFWCFCLSVTALRIGVIGLSPLGPGVDEAQYWLWGQDLQLGYYSKPPLIAWLLGLMDLLYGQSSFSLRVSGPVLHLIAALILVHIAQQISKAAGYLAGLLWLSLPATGLGSFVMSTDSVMLPFWAFALLSLQKADLYETERGKYICLAGLSVGLASLAKYAGLYFVPCLICWLIFVCHWPVRQCVKMFGLFAVMVLLASSPTWIWNLSHDFVTLFHLGENANLDKQSYSLLSMLAFLSSQAASFGPVTVFCLLFWLILPSSKTGKINQPATSQIEKGLHAFIWPIIIAISIQAFLSEANANWAVASYPGACLLLALCAVRLASRLILPAVILNFMLNSALAIILGFGSFGDFAPKSDPLRPTIIAYSRASAALLHWHLSDTDLEILLPTPKLGTGNHYQRQYPLRQDSARPFLALTGKDNLPPQIDGQWQGPITTFSTAIRTNHQRFVSFWLSE